MTTTTSEPTTTVTLRPSSLAECWAAFLESGEYEQTRYLALGRHGPNTGCAWEALEAMSGRAGLESLIMVLHPWANTVAWRLGYDSLADANDYGKTFAEIAAAMREELDSAPV